MDPWTLVLLLFICHGVLLSFVVVLEQRQPVATIAWVLILLFVPVVGVLAYYMIGRARFARRSRLRARALTQLDIQIAAMEEDFVVHDANPLGTSLPGEGGVASDSLNQDFYGLAMGNQLHSLYGMMLEPEQEPNRPLIMLAKRVVDMPLAVETCVTLLNDAEQTYNAMGEAIRQAKEHIHISYYIFRSDEAGTWIRDLLVARAEEGVEVRFLYDWIGSYELDAEFLRPLLEAGALCAPFQPLRWQWKIRQSTLNFRNHRKILVIDGKVGFTGGINVGNEYLGRDPKIGFWRDDHARFEGPAVRQLQQVFAEDWCFTTKEALTQKRYFPEWNERPGRDLVQMISSGPDHPWYSIRLLFFLAITSADDRVWITTPYFVPDDSILTALTTSALRGVDVRLLLPAITDQKLVLYAGRSYYRDLLRAGVRIYEYKKGMLHTKTMVVDGRCGTIGSANMDIRSFHLNFELNAFVYSLDFAMSLEETFLKDIDDAEEIDLIDYASRPFRRRLMEAGSRLLSPLL